MGKEFTVADLQALMKSAAENGIGELCYESEGAKIRIRNHPAVVQAAPAVYAAPAPVMAAPAPAAPAEPLPAAAPAGQCVLSPLVGTFYSAAGPDKPPYVKVGQQVKEGETVFIVESMKVMNEIPADCSGTVAEILVADGAAVEYGQPILRIE